MTIFKCRQKGKGISILIPFRSSTKFLRQGANFRWLKRYWECALPGAEIIIGKDHHKHKAFSKAVAVNHAAARAKGDIFVIVDADGYLPVDAVLKCAREIRQARKRDQKLWFVPYRRFYRLTDRISQRVLDSDPCDPYTFPKSMRKCDIQNGGGSGQGRGHWYGALCQIVPREAFDAVGGWDVRFRGWGGEDHSIMRATDTLYWKHKTLPGAIYHLWHPMLGKSSKEFTKGWVEWKSRIWANQENPGSNGNLASRYSRANGDPAKMQALVNESIVAAEQEDAPIIREILRIVKRFRGRK